MAGDGLRLVTVACPNHSEVLVRGLWNFFLAKHGADYDFQFGGLSIKAHRLIMDVFLSPDKLTPNPENADPEWNKLSGPDTLLEFIYNGKVVIPEEELDNLLNTARHLDFQMLVDAVETASDDLEMVNRAIEMEKDRRVRSCRLNLSLQQGEELSGTSPEHSDWDKEWEAPAVPKKRLRVARIKKMSSRTPLGKDLPTAPSKKRTVKSRNRKSKTNASTTSPSASDQELNHDDSGKIDVDGGVSEEAEWLNNVEDAGVAGSGQSSRHLVGRVFKCPLCEFEMAKKSSYVYHLKAIHKVEHEGPDPVPIRKTFKCPDCDYVGPNRSKLKTHSVCHSISKPFRCDICLILFRRKGDLVRHHKEIHLDMKRYMCELCGRKFTNEFALNRHRRVHTGEKPFACETCNPVRRFADRTTYERHVRRHVTNEKNYMCAICGRTFVVRYNLNAHTKRCHKDVLTAVSSENVVCKNAEV